MLIQEQGKNQFIIISDDTSISALKVSNGHVNLDPNGVKASHVELIPDKWYSPLTEFLEHLAH